MPISFVLLKYMSLLNTISSTLSKLGSFWHQRENGQLFRLNLTLIVVQLSYLIVKFNDLPPQVPLYYSEPWGENQLASAGQLFLLPSIAIVVGLLNNFIAAILLNRITLLSRLLIVFSLVVSGFSLVTLYQIITLVN